MKKLFFISILVLLISSVFAQSAADSLLNFIKENKSRSSLFLTVNDTVMGHLNENTMMPLASTVKILVAIEFAKQAAKDVFNKNEMISLKELDKYYLPNTDGNAHPNWIAYERQLNHIKNDSISLINIARGMIIFSSNANTEYLMDLLGLDNITHNNDFLGIKNHSVIYPMVASLFIYQNPKKKTEDYILKGISRLTEEQYCRFIYDMHKALKYDTILKSKFRPQDLTMKMQKAWSDRLPSSTTKDYVHACRVINSRKFLDSATYNILATVLETLMENPANKQWMEHAGAKGGSTAWVLTKAIYATTKKGDQIEMAYFFNNLSEKENKMLQGWMNSFELNVLSKSSFRKNIKMALN